MPERLDRYSSRSSDPTAPPHTGSPRRVVAGQGDEGRPCGTTIATSRRNARLGGVHDDDGAAGVRDDVLGDRAEQYPDHPAASSTSDDQQVGVGAASSSTRTG